MAFQLAYQRLFELEIRHDFYLDDTQQKFPARTAAERSAALQRYDIGRDFDIAPTPATAARMRGLGIVAKATPWGFIAGIEAEGGKPRRGLPPALGLSFALRSKNPAFHSFSNLPLAKAPGSVFLMHNLQPAAHFPFLSAPLPAHDGATAYESGALIQAGGATYKSLQGGVLPPPPAAAWKALPEKGYLHAGDQVLLVTPRFTLTLPAPGAASLNLQIEDAYGHTQSLGSLNGLGAPLLQLQPDLSAFEEGFYTLSATGTRFGGGTLALSVPLYLDSSGSLSDAWGIVHLVHGTAVTAPYAWLNGSGLIQKPVYQVQLNNRDTVWRYRFRKAPAPGTNMGILSGGGVLYQTPQPLPLTFSLSPLNWAKGSLPGPDPSRLAPEAGGQALFSDIYIHN